MRLKNFLESEKSLDNGIILQQMEEAAHKAGIDLRYENLADDEVNIGSGLCYIRRQPLLIIDKRLSPQAKWAVLARELASIDLNSIYLPPLIRKLIETTDQ